MAQPLFNLTKQQKWPTTVVMVMKGLHKSVKTGRKNHSANTPFELMKAKKPTLETIIKGFPPSSTSCFKTVNPWPHGSKTKKFVFAKLILKNDWALWNGTNSIEDVLPEDFGLPTEEDIENEVAKMKKEPSEEDVKVMGEDDE
ncbi:uncharacterized protein VP01_4258g1 [Puccinia sorghi]|uniref:Uncharacterized protein n=1 Tax=Puccinia sorghi TaxID=27349 RepID=A0A0L6UQD6_9BASI|nr:uncharacterized protein VP01_4258g1 [Puccinia sorghi]